LLGANFLPSWEGTVMGLRSLLIGMVVMLLAVQARADTAEEVERAVNALQKAYDRGDVDALKELMTEDHVTTLSYARFSSRADQLKVLTEFKLTEYRIEGLKVKPLTRDVALATYQATIRGTYKGKEVPSSVQVSEIWIKRDGKWLEAVYVQTPLQSK